jgi:hypothetical protein
MLWNDCLDSKFQELKYKKSTADRCLYYQWESNKLKMAAVYADDRIVCAHDTDKMDVTIKELKERINEKVLHRLTYILRIKEKECSKT